MPHDTRTGWSQPHRSADPASASAAGRSATSGARAAAKQTDPDQATTQTPGGFETADSGPVRVNPLPRGMCAAPLLEHRASAPGRAISPESPGPPQTRKKPRASSPPRASTTGSRKGLINVTTTDKATEYAAGLRALADMVEANPELAELLWYGIGYLDDSLNTREELAAVVRAALKAGARVEKEQNDKFFYTVMFFGGVQLKVSVNRDEVCERIVTGTEVVTKKVKDPDALAAVPEIEVTEEVEIVEWRCVPLLADRPEEDAESTLAGAL